MAFLDFLFGTKERTEQFQRYTPQQQAFMDMLLGGAKKQVPQGFDFLESIIGQSPEAMQRFERPAMRQFEEDILPSIAERFTGSFGSGSQKSSAFGQQLGKAGERLAENLQAQRGKLSFDALSALQQLFSGGLGQRSDTVVRQAQPGFLGELIGQAPAALGAYFGGL